MLNSIVDLSLRYKVLVLVGFLLVVVFGVKAFRDVPVDAFPDVTPVQVNVYTESPGLAAEDVEKLLTFPVETAMAGLPGVEEIRSVSLFGLSFVSVYFKDDVDIYFARRLVGEKMLEAKARMPEGTRLLATWRVCGIEIEMGDELLGQFQTQGQDGLHAGSTGAEVLLVIAGGQDDRQARRKGHMLLQYSLVTIVQDDVANAGCARVRQTRDGDRV